MRPFTDLHLRPTVSEQANDMLLLAKEMGYKHAAFVGNPPNKQIPEFTFATRVDVEARKQRELIDVVGKVRKWYDIIAVKCLTKEAARQAAKDDRIDIILFPEDPTQRRTVWLDIHQAELTSGTGCAYEVNLNELLDVGALRLSRLITQIKKEIGNAQKHDIPIIFSSGASTSILMREPKALAALASLFDIDEDYALNMISKTPAEMLIKNLKKRERQRNQNAG